MVVDGAPWSCRFVGANRAMGYLLSVADADSLAPASILLIVCMGAVQREDESGIMRAGIVRG